MASSIFIKMIEFPGLVYDTPELIATLTTDKEDEVHGTHTAGIAAGARYGEYGDYGDEGEENVKRSDE